MYGKFEKTEHIRMTDPMPEGSVPAYYSKTGPDRYAVYAAAPVRACYFLTYSLLFKSGLFFHHGDDFAREGEAADEAGGVLVVIE